MVLSAKTYIVMAALAAAAFLMISSAFAAPGNSGDTKPGWGYGDKNHTHTGPPGQSVSPKH